MRQSPNMLQKKEQEKEEEQRTEKRKVDEKTKMVANY